MQSKIKSGTSNCRGLSIVCDGGDEGDERDGSGSSHNRDCGAFCR